MSLRDAVWQKAWCQFQPLVPSQEIPMKTLLATSPSDDRLFTAREQRITYCIP